MSRSHFRDPSLERARLILAYTVPRAHRLPVPNLPPRPTPLPLGRTTLPGLLQHRRPCCPFALQLYNGLHCYQATHTDHHNAHLSNHLCGCASVYPRMRATSRKCQGVGAAQA